MVMSDGVIVEMADSDEIYLNPKQEYTRKLLSSIPKGIERAAVV
jgi:peptide/nickel transport system ATP-binding protein